MKILDAHKTHFPYLTGFFLEADRWRKQRLQETQNESFPDFGLVAEVLNQESFIIVTKALREAFDMSQFAKVQGGMICLLQIVYFLPSFD